MKKKLIALALALSLIAMLLLAGCTAADSNGLGDMYVNNIYPNPTNTYDLGSSTYEWNNVWTQNINGSPYTGSSGAGTTLIHALVPIQINQSCDGTTTTCTVGGTYYVPAGETTLTTNATYKRYVSMKVSAHTSTGTATISLWDVTQGASLATVTTAATSETAIASTSVTGTVTVVGDVVEIQVKNSSAGATVTIDSGGIMEADMIKNVTGTGNASLDVYGDTGYVSSINYLAMQGLSTASITIQPYFTVGSGALAGAQPTWINIGLPFSTVNSPVSVSVPYILFDTENQNVTAITGQFLIGAAMGVSVFNMQ